MVWGQEDGKKELGWNPIFLTLANIFFLVKKKKKKKKKGNGKIRRCTVKDFKRYSFLTQKWNQMKWTLIGVGKYYT